MLVNDPFHHQPTNPYHSRVEMLVAKQRPTSSFTSACISHTVVMRARGGDSILVQMAWVEKPKTCGSSSSQTTSLTLAKNLLKDYKVHVHGVLCISNIGLILLCFSRKGERKLGGWDDNRIQYHAVPFTSQHHWAVNSNWVIDECNHP